MDHVLEQLVEHITRYLDQDIPQDKIEHVLKQNDLEDGALERAFSIVRARKAQEAAEAKAKKEAEEAAEAVRRKEAAARRKKRQEAAREAAREAAKKSAAKPRKSDSIHHPGPVDIVKSSDAEALPQDTAISLHAPPEQKNKPLPIPEVESEEFMLADLNGLEELGDSEILLHDVTTSDTGGATESDDLSIMLDDDKKTGDARYSTQAEPSLAEELLGSSKAWDDTQSPLRLPDRLVNEQQSLPRGSVIYQSASEPGAGPQFNPVASEPQYGSFANANNDTSKYPVFVAIQDSIVAARANLITYLVSVITAYIVSATTFMLTVLAIGKFFALPHSVLLTPPSKVFVSVAGSIIFYAVWAILAGAFSLTIMSIALFDSSQSRKTSVSSVMAKSLIRFKRVAKTMIRLVAVALAPLAIVALIPVFAVGFHGTTSLPYILPALYVVAFAWAVFTATRYGMAPYVALFERLTSSKKTFARSQILSSGAGQLFIAKSTVSVTALCVLLAYFIHYRPQATAQPLNTIIDLVLLATVTAANGALVMLYCNRKLFKG